MNLLLQMNIVAAVLIIAIVIIRALALYKLPKKTFLALWGVAALRLLIPVRTPLPFDIFPDDGGQPIGDVTVTTSNVPVDPVVTLPPSVIEQTSPAQFPWEAVWIAGICIMALYFLISWLRFLREAKASLPCENEYAAQWLAEHPLRRTIQIRQSDRISAPLTYGILRPVILMPKTVEWENEDALRCILTHEYIHIRRFDTLAKLIFAAVVCIHWFNPLTWVMYILASRDIELSCDEAATDELGNDKRAAYLHVLVNLEETKTRMAFPLASHFGKHAIHERMSAVMKKRTYTLPILIAALVLVLAGCTVAAIGLVDEPDYDSVLASGLSDEELETYTAYFEAEGATDYLIDGGTIYVSSDRLEDYKWMVLEATFEPLPHVTIHEYEAAYPEDSFSGDRDVAVIHYMQGQLEKVIKEYDRVDDAAVILTTRDGVPAASVLVTMEDGQKLTSEQVTAISRLLVDSAGEILPGLTAGNISIADAEGNTYLLEESQRPLDGYTEAYDSEQQNFDSGNEASGELGQQNFDNYTVVEDHPGLIGTESNIDLPDYVEADAGNEVIYTNEHVGSETVSRTLSDMELEVKTKLTEAIQAFDDVELVEVNVQTNEKDKIDVQIRLSEGNDLTDAQFRELYDLFLTIVPIEKSGALGVSFVVKTEIIPAEDTGVSYILP